METGLRVIDGRNQLVRPTGATSATVTSTLMPLGEDEVQGEEPAAQGGEGDDGQDAHGEHERDGRDGLGQDMAAETDDREIAEGAEEVLQEGGEEGREGVGLSIPPTVSRQEREQHELTHTPYRSWCRHCVRARGRKCNINMIRTDIAEKL